jgi:serine/threonine protein kinase
LKKLSFTEIEKIFNDVLEALQELHDHGIAHRDIKLENILVNPNGHAKVTDLGFLKRTSGFEKEDIDNLLGTVQYLAPEYIKHGHYDYRSDLYAVALMLFECLSGRRWLAGKSPEQSLNYLYEINFEFPKLALSGMSVKFTQVLERGLANQPWKRFDSARSMRLAILSENGSEKPFKSVNVKESVNIQDVSARRKTQEFLSLKKKRNDRLILIALIFFVFVVATACIYSFARSMISAESAANTEAAFSDTVEIHPNHIDLNQVEDLNETNELEGYQLKD